MMSNAIDCPACGGAKWKKEADYYSICTKCNLIKYINSPFNYYCRSFIEYAVYWKLNGHTEIIYYPFGGDSAKLEFTIALSFDISLEQIKMLMVFQ